MKFRFVYVDRAGAQVDIESVEALRSAVVAGELHDATLLYDGLTRDWAPARVHPIYRLIREAIEAEGGEAEPTLLPDTLVLTGPRAEDAVPPAPTEAEFTPELDLDLDLSLDLRTAPEVVAEVEDHEARFWAERAREEEEARLEGKVEPAFGATDLELHDGRADRIARVDGDAAADPPAPAVDEGIPSVDAPGDDVVDVSWPAPDRIGPLDVPTWDVDRSLVENLSLAMHTVVPRRQAALMVLLAGVGGWAIADSWAPVPVSDGGPEFVNVASAYTVGRHFTRGHADVRTAAFRDMVIGMDQLRGRMGVGTPPEAWLSPDYLAHPSEHTDVARYWGRYDSLVDALRAREEDLFRSGYVTRMQRKGITGTVLTIQLARALVEFRDDAPRREGLYRSMDELATAALALHEALLVDEGARAGQAPGGTPGAARELEVERVLQALRAVGGSDPVEDGRLGNAAVAGLARLEIRDSASD